MSCLFFFLAGFLIRGFQYRLKNPHILRMTFINLLVESYNVGSESCHLLITQLFLCVTSEVYMATIPCEKTIIVK